MVKRPHHRETRMIAEIHEGNQRFDLIGINHPAVDALNLVDFGPPAHGAQRGIGVGQRHVATLWEHDIEIKIFSQILIQFDTFIIKEDPLRSQIVGADDGGVSTTAPTPNVPFVQNRYIGNPIVSGQVIGRGQTVYPTANDNHIIALFHWLYAPHRW